jgi:hypothetical protein
MPQPDHIVKVPLPDEAELDGGIKNFYAKDR